MFKINVPKKYFLNLKNQLVKTEKSLFITSFFLYSSSFQCLITPFYVYNGYYMIPIANYLCFVIFREKNIYLIEKHFSIKQKINSFISD